MNPRTDPTDPANMTPDERLADRHVVPTESSTPVNLNNPVESAPNCLEVGSETRLHGQRG